MKRKEELNENQTRPLSPVGPNRAVVGLLYVCFRITIFLVWLSPTSSATLSSLLTLSLYLSFAASLSAVFFSHILKVPFCTEVIPKMNFVSDTS